MLLGFFYLLDKHPYNGVQHYFILDEFLLQDKYYVELSFKLNVF